MRPVTISLRKGNFRQCQKVKLILLPGALPPGPPAGLCPCTLPGASSTPKHLTCGEASRPHSCLLSKYLHLLQIVLTALIYRDFQCGKVGQRYWKAAWKPSLSYMSKLWHPTIKIPLEILQNSLKLMPSLTLFHFPYVKTAFKNRVMKKWRLLMVRFSRNEDKTRQLLCPWSKDGYFLTKRKLQGPAEHHNSTPSRPSRSQQEFSILQSLTKYYLWQKLDFPYPVVMTGQSEEVASLTLQRQSLQPPE